MDVLLFTNTFPPQQSPLAEWVIGLREELTRQGPRVLVVAPGLSPDAGSERGLTRLDLGSSGPKPLEQLEEGLPGDFRPSLVHAFDPFLTGEVALRFARRRDIPLVFTPSLLYPGLLDSLAGTTASTAALAGALATRFALASDLLVASDRRIREEFSRRKVEVPSRVVPPGVAPFWFRNADLSRPPSAPPGDGVCVGVVGRVARDTEALRVRARNLLEAAGVPGTVESPGRLGREGLRAFFAGIDVLLEPSGRGSAFCWEGHARAMGASVLSPDRPEEASRLLVELRGERPTDRVERRRRNVARARPVSDAVQPLLRYYRTLTWRYRPRRSRAGEDLPDRLHEARETLARAWTRLDLRSELQVVRAA